MLRILSQGLLEVLMASVCPLKGSQPGLNQQHVWSKGKSKAIMFFLSFWMHLPQKPCFCLSLWKSCGLREKVHTCVSVCACAAWFLKCVYLSWQELWWTKMFHFFTDGSLVLNFCCCVLIWSRIRSFCQICAFLLYIPWDGGFNDLSLKKLQRKLCFYHLRCNDVGAGCSHG